jgi:TonB family protein
MEKRHHVLLLILILFSVFQGKAQDAVMVFGRSNAMVVDSIYNNPDKGYIYTIVEKMPQFPKDSGDIQAYIIKHYKGKPLTPFVCGIQGRTIVQFVVNETGKISDVKVVRKLDPSLDAEAIRIVEHFPDWIPGEQKGKKVKVRYTLPVSFNIQ